MQKIRRILMEDRRRNSWLTFAPLSGGGRGDKYEYFGSRTLDHSIC